MTKRNQQYLNVVLFLSSGIAGARKRTKEEKDEIFKHLGNCIKKKILPGKSECLKCIEQSNGVLAIYRWLRSYENIGPRRKHVKIILLHFLL